MKTVADGGSIEISHQDLSHQLLSSRFGRGNNLKVLEGQREGESQLFGGAHLLVKL